MKSAICFGDDMSTDSSSKLSGKRIGICAWVKWRTNAVLPLVFARAKGKTRDMIAPGSPNESTEGPPHSTTCFAVIGPRTETYVALG